MIVNSLLRRRYLQEIGLGSTDTIALSLNDEFRLPAEDMPDWYGISADTASRGLKGLIGHGLLDIKKHYKSAPLSPVGYTADHLYTLQQPFGPKGQTQKRRQ